MGDELNYFETTEMTGFMRLNIIINRITTENFRIYLTQHGIAEEPKTLPYCSQRDFFVRNIQSQDF